MLLLLALACGRDKDATIDSEPVALTASCDATALSEDLSALEWQGPQSAPGGNIRFFASTSRAERLYAGSTNNGMYISNDSGESWTRLPTQRTHVLGDIAVKPDDPDTLFITSEELWRSSDAGQSWTTISGVGGTNPESGIRGLLFDNERLYVLEGGGRLFVTEDLGEHVEQIAQLENPVLPPPHAGGFADETWRWQMVSNGSGTIYAMLHRVGLYRSTDGGYTWDTVHRGFVSAGTLGADGDTVWFGQEGMLMLSVDGGDTFNPQDPFDENVVALAAGPDGDYAAATAHQIFRGTLGRLLPVADAPSGDVEVLRFLPDGTLLIGHGEGIATLADGSDTLVDHSDGLLDPDLAVLMVHPDCPQKVWVGTQCQRGLYASDDFGKTLAHIPFYMHYVMVPQINPMHPDELWVTNDNTLLMSPDLGQTWSQISPMDLAYHFHGLGIDPIDPRHILMGSVGSGIWNDTTMRVYASHDAGATWQDQSTGLPQSVASAHVLHFVQSDPDVVLLGTFRGDDISHAGDPGVGLYRSTDRGESWSKVGIEALDIAHIAECDGRLYAAADLAILRSDDAGQSWQSALEREAQVLAVACYGATVLAMDQNENVLRSDDGGDTWSDWTQGIRSRGLGRQYLHDLAITGDGAVALLAVGGEGLYRRKLNEDP